MCLCLQFQVGINNNLIVIKDKKTRLMVLFFFMKNYIINALVKLWKRGSRLMVVSKDEILHIANLADLNIKDDEIDEYAKNLQDILNFVDILNKVDTENVEESIGVVNNTNVFRKDEIKVFEDRDALLQNAPDQENNMFKIPKVI